MTTTTITGGDCAHCHRLLPADGPSLDFCGEACQHAWQHLRAIPLPEPRLTREPPPPQPDRGPWKPATPAAASL